MGFHLRVPFKVVQARSRDSDITERFTREISSLRLASVIKSAANSMNECGIPREKFNII